MPGGFLYEGGGGQVGRIWKMCASFVRVQMYYCATQEVTDTAGVAVRWGLEYAKFGIWYGLESDFV
jgi:hypothetical protein